MGQKRPREPHHFFPSLKPQPQTAEQMFETVKALQAAFGGSLHVAGDR